MDEVSGAVWVADSCYPLTTLSGHLNVLYPDDTQVERTMPPTGTPRPTRGFMTSIVHPTRRMAAGHRARPAYVVDANVAYVEQMFVTQVPFLPFRGAF